jgi:hypothetical protein
VVRTFSNDKSKSDNRFSNDKLDRAGKSRQLDGYTVSYHPCTYCGKNHNPSVCQLINHPESNKNEEWVNSASYKKCKELFFKDKSRLKSFPTLPMFKDTAGNAVTYEATNKPRRLPSQVGREYCSRVRPTTRIVLVVTTASVLEMMHRRRVKIVANMSVYYCTLPEFCDVLQYM